MRIVLFMEKEKESLNLKHFFSGTMHRKDSGRIHTKVAIVVS